MRSGKALIVSNFVTTLQPIRYLQFHRMTGFIQIECMLGSAKSSFFVCGVRAEGVKYSCPLLLGNLQVVATIVHIYGEFWFSA